MRMKKVYLASALLLAVTGAQAYQAEVQGTVGYYDAELNDGNYNVGVQGTYYFKDIDTSKGPLAEAAFLNQASSISAGYNFGQLTADINQTVNVGRSEEHTSELQSRENLVCRLLLEKKKKNKKKVNINEN